jgi:hypothetical protein
VVGAALAAGIGITGRVAAASADPAPAFRAVDLADAVLFDDGPAAAYLVGFERPGNTWTDPARRHRAAVNDAIEADQRWARSFASRLQSGDRMAVDSALLDLAVLARAQADRLFGKDAVDKVIEAAHNGEILVALTPPTRQTSLDYLIQVTDAVIAVYTVVSSLTSEPARLLQDRLVNEIAAHLATSR